MRQITLRGFDDQLEARIVQLARARSISLNKAALELLRRGAGLEGAVQPAHTSIGSSLDKFVGVWSREDEDEFLRSIDGLEQVDPDLWK